LREIRALIPAKIPATAIQQAGGDLQATAAALEKETAGSGLKKVSALAVLTAPGQTVIRKIRLEMAVTALLRPRETGAGAQKAKAKASLLGGILLLQKALQNVGPLPLVRRTSHLALST
jgi:hypothetical protein